MRGLIFRSLRDPIAPGDPVARAYDPTDPRALAALWSLAWAQPRGGAYVLPDEHPCSVASLTKREPTCK